jgi:hypothetical protein
MKTDINELLKRHPAEIYLWLEDWIKQGKPVSHDTEINWLGLAESAAANACNQYECHTVLERILWANIGVTVREHLAKGESEFLTSAASAMAIRHNLIMDFGNHPGDPLCDSNVILKWFYDTLPMTLEEARIEAQNWHEHPDKRKIEFRYAIERLELLQHLAGAGKMEMDRDLPAWLELLATIRPNQRASG